MYKKLPAQAKYSLCKRFLMLFPTAFTYSKGLSESPRIFSCEGTERHVGN